MAVERFTGPLSSQLGFESLDQGVGLYRTYSSTIFTSTATYITKFKSVQGVIPVLKGSAAPAANTPVIFKMRYSNATVYLRGYTVALGAPAAAATLDIYIKGIYG